MAKTFVIFKVKGVKHPTYPNQECFTCVEVNDSDAQAYATDFASKNPGVECWLANPKQVTQVQPGPMTIRAFNTKGELLPV